MLWSPVCGGGDKSIPIITLKLSQNLLFRKEHITKPYLLKLGNWKAVAFLNTLKEHSTLFDITWLTSIEIFFEHFCTISVQVLCDKVRGEGGEPKYDFVWYGGREGLEKGQIVLHNTWTAPKQSWNTHETAMKHCWNTTPPWVSNIPKLKLEHFWEKKMRKCVIYHQIKERGCQIDSFYFLVIYSS